METSSGEIWRKNENYNNRGKDNIQAVIGSSALSFFCSLFESEENIYENFQTILIGTEKIELMYPRWLICCQVIKMPNVWNIRTLHFSGRFHCELEFIAFDTVRRKSSSSSSSDGPIEEKNGNTVMITFTLPWHIQSWIAHIINYARSEFT